MSTPDERAAAQIAGMADDAPAPVASEQEIAEGALAHTGLGVTEADLDAIKAQLASFARQLAASQASATAAPDALAGSVGTLVHHLGAHGDPAAVELGKDAVEAAASVASGGTTGALAGVIGKIIKHLQRNPPYPGENFHYNSALSLAQSLPEVIDRAAERNPGSDPAPAKVVAGSVVG